MTTTTRNDAQSLTKHEAREELRDQAKLVGSEIKDLAGKSKAAAREFVDETKDRASDALESGKDWMGEADVAFRDCVRQNPIRSVLIAAGAGCLAAMLLRRR